jgi:hypothetical protein
LGEEHARFVPNRMRRFAATSGIAITPPATWELFIFTLDEVNPCRVEVRAIFYRGKAETYRYKWFVSWAILPNPDMSAPI